MSAMRDHLIRRIRASGPMTVAEYMTEALLHPTLGYYPTRDPLGAAGDFTTAPEISQMFGEMIGLALAQSWLDQGSPAPFTLAEPGPGRGTLMADILRATRAIPGFHAALQLYLIEASPTLRAKQRETLGDTATWLDALDQLPEQPLFLVANEFFDALPIRQFLRGETGWQERLIGLRDDALTVGLGPEQSVAALDHRLADTIPGNIVELCAPAPALVQSIGQRIHDHGGVALILDYGDWRSNGDTLQALREHTPVEPLACPGEADLTAHVDFEALAAATPSAHSSLTPQGVFLERLGITQRAQSLASKLTGDALSSHIAAHRRLTHPDEMGNLFKLLALFPEGTTPPPGCDP
ncbi:class I SAM-dependent methyltransferase [Shimia abyssi]|uniref:SAM-dependent MidA family methyltransferase n=1 Tax=Shimia abyssi TaxID=1662395 RepID=A0A2P8F8Y9_9RHOB|nr:SAM-dependent methyltransferase [Shimia abyssi]PSL18190.1 SAM-dependent MidA family methyltransferase [Shimia abyssi]